VTLSLTWCDDKKKWDRFVESSPQSNVFCSTPFLDALGEEYDLLFVEDKGSPQIGAVVVKHDGKPVDAPFPYQGILFNHSKLNVPYHSRVRWGLEVTDYLLSEMEKHYDRISFCLHYTVEDIRSIQWFHYHESQKGLFNVALYYTGILDLQTINNFNEYLLAIRKVRRYEYRHALSEKLTIEVSDDIAILNQLHKSTFKRQGITRCSEEERFLLSISQAAISNGFGQLLLCTNKSGLVIAANLFLYDSKCGYYLFGASDPEFRNNYGGTLLLLENIRRCKERGLRNVDFVGINSPNRGDFKTSFNAKPVPYFVTTLEKKIRTK
jgi:hypothetical protein